MKNSIDNYKISELIAKHHLKIASADDEELLNNWLQEKTEHRELYNKILNRKKLSKKINSYLSYDSVNALKENGDFSTTKKTVGIYKQIFRYAAVIMLPLAIAGSLLWYFYPNDLIETQRADINIPAGYSKAVLKMGNGKIVNLERTKIENLKEIDGTIISSDAKTLRFKVPENVKELPPPVMQEITIPRKGEFNTILPDGTKVWLNSETVLEFPSRFTGKERRLTLKKGEAYFDVAHNAERPFIVTSEKSIVKVYGTSFNISAYEDEVENITTLVEGSISLRHRYDENSTIMLEPGEQASITSVNRRIKKRKVETDHYTSWTRGEFTFENTNIEAVLKKLSRWYDVDFDFKNDNKRDYHFTGTLKRYENISEILGFIEYTSKLRFSKENNTIYVN